MPQFPERPGPHRERRALDSDTVPLDLHSPANAEIFARPYEYDFEQATIEGERIMTLYNTAREEGVNTNLSMFDSKGNKVTIEFPHLLREEREEE